MDYRHLAVSTSDFFVKIGVTVIEIGLLKVAGRSCQNCYGIQQLVCEHAQTIEFFVSI